ncbi:ankyrin repeat domain-containing protein [bacterium]|nr:ankyrin repeat domain-containing protein [bacterium]
MKKFLIIFNLVFCFSFKNVFASAIIDNTKNYLEQNQLYDLYKQRLEKLKNTKDFKKIVKSVINLPLNNEYKNAYLKDIFNSTYLIDKEFAMNYAIHYDVNGTIKYLESLPKRNLSQDFQLLLLWHIYNPEKINSDDFKDIVKKLNLELLEYFEAKKWQSSWRKEEYAENVKNDYQACYADINCFLEIIPYWQTWGNDFETYIPCDVAQKYEKVAYLDSAGGGHGSAAFLTSDCDLFEKYKYSKELQDYINLISREKMDDSDGTIRFLFYALSTYNNLTDQYQPNFDTEELEDNTDFPYTEWAVLSYRNFKKFNEVLNFGIGYKNAVDMLTKHYVDAFGVDEKKARNTALKTLFLPSDGYWKRIKPDNLYYMLLTGKDWEEIKKVNNPSVKDYSRFIKYSIAYPKNIEKIMLDESEENNTSLELGDSNHKTPLMLASQYGYLDTVKLLIEYGVRVNLVTKDSDCWGTLHSPYCINNGKRTALMYALQGGHYDIAKYLIENGANISLKDSKGNTAYDYMLGKAPYYDPNKMAPIHSGYAIYRSGENESLFSDEQIKELTPLLKTDNME